MRKVDARLIQRRATCRVHFSNAVFLIALIVPIAMYLIGLVILMVSLVVKHFGLTHAPSHSIEALAH